MHCKKHEPAECVECIKEEIAKLEKKLTELKAKLPVEKTVIITVPVYPHPITPAYPVWPFSNDERYFCTCENGHRSNIGTF